MENEKRDVSKNKIEVLRLIEFLQDEIDAGGKVPFSNKVMVDKALITQLIDDIIQNLPEDFNTAQYVIEEKERILEDAHEEYKKIKEEANEVMRSQVNNHTIVKEAENKSKEIIAKAQLEAKNMRMYAREYVDGLFSDMQKEIEKNSNDALESMNAAYGEFTSKFQNRLDYTSNTLKENIEQLKEMK